MWNAIVRWFISHPEVSAAIEQAAADAVKSALAKKAAKK